MNKTIERLIIAGMIAVLATAFFQVAHATNESSQTTNVCLKLTVIIQ